MKPVQPGGILGFEGAGTVEKLGSDVQGLSVGDRVAFGFVGASKKTSINELITIIFVWVVWAMHQAKCNSQNNK